MIKISGKYTTATIMIDDLDEASLSQIQSIVNHPSCTNPIVIMPDVHSGSGIVIGFTMEMSSLLVPNFIGVDIGCGINGVNLGKFNVTKKDLLDLDNFIRKEIPMGPNIRELTPFDFKTIFPWEKVTTMKNDFIKKFNEKFNTNYDPNDYKYDYDWFEKTCKKIGMGPVQIENSIGTLGGGNHYIELGTSEETGNNWIHIHSGSRNFGKRICDFHSDIAKNSWKNEYKKASKEIIDNSNKIEISMKLLELKEKFRMNSIEQLSQENDILSYLLDMIFTQEFASVNRNIMQYIISKFFQLHPLEQIDTIHNYIDFNDWIIRKGAIRSVIGEKMLIPMNMKDGLLLCSGKSNPNWNYSAPHGAGRLFSRTEAKNKINLEEFEKIMVGIYSTSICESTLDESPFAYKNPKIIESLIQDTCLVEEHIRPIYVIKSSFSEIKPF